MTLKDIDFLSGHVQYNKLVIDSNTSLEQQTSKLDSDLLYVSYSDGLYVVDVGWLPSYEPSGSFIVRVIKDSNWNQPLYIKETRSFIELELYLQAYIYIVNNLIDKNNPVAVFEKSDKRRMYWLIDQYLLNAITATEFCDQFYYSYDLEINHDDLTSLEKKYFSELSNIVDRFSSFKEDTQHRGFYNEDQLRNKVIEVKNALIMSK